MSDARKETLMRWLPAFIALVGFVGNAVYVGRWIGQVEQRVEFLEKRPGATENMATFVSRNEFVLLKENLNSTLGRIEQKLDRVVERENGRVSKND